MFRWLKQTTGTSCTTTRKTKTQKAKILLRVFVVSFLGIASFAIVFNSLAEIIEGNDARLDVDSELTYYLSVKEDGVDAEGVESSDTQMANITSGRISVTDRIPDGLVFQGFVTTSDGTFGAVSRSDHSIQCAGKVVDDTNEEAVDTGTWNNAHTEYYYHGLHYNANTRVVSFTAEKIKAGCELTVGIITKTPATIDDPDTTVVETRRDFYNTAFAAEKDLTATSNTVHAWMGSSSTNVYNVTYSYTGDVPPNAPDVPGVESYQKDANVAVGAVPTLAGYTFNGWTTSDVTVTNDEFTMPNQNVTFVGVWVQDLPSTEYTVTYVIEDEDEKPADFMPPAEKSYEANRSVSLDSTAEDDEIDGYRFSGWSSDDVNLSETGFTMPNHDVVIRGSFSRISYTVCYEFEGSVMPNNADDLLPECETYYPGDTVVTADDPTADGYQFVGWYKNPTFEMPNRDVIIQGEWGTRAGTFEPTIAKTLVDAKDEYIYGETVKFKITVTNTANFTIKDVFLEEQLDGAVFTDGTGYTVKTSTIALIPQIAANSSVDVYAEYKVTDNVSETLTNIVELTGAIADNYTLDEDGDYVATVDFDTAPEPAPLTGIIFNALPYIGLTILGVAIAFVTKIRIRRNAYR